MQPGNRYIMSSNGKSLSKLFANVFQSFSALLTSALTLVWAKHKCPWILLHFFCPILSPALILSLLNTLQSNCTFQCLEMSPCSPAWHDQLAWASERKRWLLGKVILAPMMSVHSGAELEQVSECDVSAVPSTGGSHLSPILGAGGNWDYDACHDPAARMEELKYFAKGRKACFLGCWFVCVFFILKGKWRCWSYYTYPFICKVWNISNNLTMFLIFAQGWHYSLQQFCLWEKRVTGDTVVCFKSGFH